VKTYRPVQRVVLTDEVERTLFEDFQSHRRGSRGSEEIGWVMLGVRLEDEVLVLATLPAGTARSASSVHVRFDSEAQAVGSLAVRQKDKRLTIVGVVHTHPGSLRHPSDGDYQGDIQWVGRLRGGEGVFAIGTADGGGRAEHAVHMRTQEELCYSWYVLGKDDRHYRRLPVELTKGPDLARPLHPVWPVMETYAAELLRLCRQQAGVTLECDATASGSVLCLNLKLAEPGTSLRVLLDPGKIQYYLGREGAYSPVQPQDDGLERAIYLMLADLAGKRLAATR
jgi:proteasome lid subunit RPN8/RPN11